MPLSEEQRGHGFRPLVVTVSSWTLTRPLASSQGLNLNSGHCFQPLGLHCVCTMASGRRRGLETLLTTPCPFPLHVPAWSLFTATLCE